LALLTLEPIVFIPKVLVLYSQPLNFCLLAFHQVQQTDDGFSRSIHVLDLIGLKSFKHRPSLVLNDLGCKSIIQGL
jgi:hypothetical protein